jgi:putative Mg2+ transporter-C (MgtC) family protein
MNSVLSFSEEIDLLVWMFPKILIATICGFIVGYDRERKNKVAGLRTNVLICVGSCIFTIGSFLAAKYYDISDPTRILSTIVTGIGFLGGGVIMRTDDKIIGMTTAAFIWVISAIGILCGMGFWVSPVLLTIGLVIVLYYFESVEKYIKKEGDKKNETRN